MTVEPRAQLRLSSAAGRWVMLATVLGSSVAMLDSTVVNIALPAIAEELGGGMAGLQWTVNGYTLTLAGLILLGGALGDRFGRRRLFVIGVIWFALASALCAAAPNVGVLIGARALQGIGGALLTPGSLAIIQASFTAYDRPRAVGAWAGLGGVAGALGPFLGGWLVGFAGWRWVFLINLPLAAITVAVALRHVPESTGGEPTDGRPLGRFDVLGAVLAAVALTGITYALTELPAGRVDLLIMASVVVGVGTAVWFVLLERRRTHHTTGPRAMLPVDVFGSAQFTAINLVTLVVYGGLSLMMFLLVVHLQLVGGFSPIAAGAALLPVTVLMLLLSARAGALAQRVGPKPMMAIGLVVGAAGTLLMARIGPGATYLVDVLLPVTIFGIGLTAVVAPLTATVLATAEVRHAGIASGVNNAVARAAGLLAVAAVPPAVGLTGNAVDDPTVFAAGFRLAMTVSAGLLLAGAVITVIGIRGNVLRPDTGPALSPEADQTLR